MQPGPGARFLLPWCTAPRLQVSSYSQCRALRGSRGCSAAIYILIDAKEKIDVPASFFMTIAQFSTNLRKLRVCIRTSLNAQQ